MSDEACLDCRRMEKTYGKGATCKAHTRPEHFFSFPGMMQEMPIFQEFCTPALYCRVICVSSVRQGKYRGMRLWIKS